MNRDTTCVLCGVSSHDVKVGLIAWKEPVGREKYTARPRCIDRIACRSRVESVGDYWEVEDPVRQTADLVR